MRTTLSFDANACTLHAATLLLVLPSQAANAASFDCRQASLAPERAICGNPNLSQLDARTAGMYFTILGNDLPPWKLAQVKNTQRRFIANRNVCGSNVDCLVDAYTAQMMYLKNVLNP